MEEKEQAHNIVNIDTNMDLLNIAAGNQSMKTRIAYLLSILESNDAINIENQVIALLKNMLNFFSNYIDELTHFESLSPEQQQAYIAKFKTVATSITSHKIKSTDEMVQIFVFTILNTLKENIKTQNHIETTKLENKEYNSEFRNFLKKATLDKIYKTTEIKPKESNFIKEITVNSEILGEVKIAMKDAGLHFDTQNISSNSLKIFQDIQQNIKTSQQVAQRISH